jgi:hypothetical protein
MLPVFAPYYSVNCERREASCGARLLKPSRVISQTTTTITIAKLKLHIVDHRISVLYFLLHDAGLQDNEEAYSTGNCERTVGLWTGKKPETGGKATGPSVTVIPLLLVQ